MNVNQTEENNNIPNIPSQENQNRNDDRNHYNHENLQENPYDNIINEVDTDNENKVHLNKNAPIEVEDKLLTKMANLDQKLSSHTSEKLIVPSSQVVNQSEDYNRKYKLVDQNENRTENEYVFSENVNIDTLSYNEPFLEFEKKKHEEDKEDKKNK